MFRDEIAVTLNRKRFKYWTEIRITRGIDAIDTIELKAPFDPYDEDQKSTFKPISFMPTSVTVNDEPEFTGTAILCAPDMSTDSSVVTLGAYSLPGVLGDCPAPASALPAEYKKQNLHDIARVSVAPFDITVLTRVDPGPVFDKVSREPGGEVLPFLIDLAQQRGQLIASTREGALLFWEAIEDGEAVAYLEQKKSPLLGVSATFDPSKYFSELTGLRPVRVRAKKSVQFTARNTLLPNVLRPHVFEVDRAKDGDVETAVRGKMGRMFGNMVSYSVDVATWRDARGNLWEPNTMVSLLAPGAMIYKATKFLIRSIVLRKGPRSETATLSLVLPGSFSGKAPGALPWE